MNSLIIKISIFFLLIPALASAGWQVVKPIDAAPSEPIFQTPTPRPLTKVPSYGGEVLQNRYAHMGKPASVYAISVSGSVKENLERIMERYHWKIIWKVPYDYNFDGRVTGTSLPNVVEKLLKPFPLQATLYMSNRTMTVTSRKA